MCQVVKFQFESPHEFMNRCYCSRCRLASGSEFGVYVHVPLKQFQWLSGEDNIKHYVPKHGDPRPFCAECGCRVPLLEIEDNNVIIPAGILLNFEGQVQANIFMASKAVWSDAYGKASCYKDHIED